MRMLRRRRRAGAALHIDLSAVFFRCLNELVLGPLTSHENRHALDITMVWNPAMIEEYHNLVENHVPEMRGRNVQKIVSPSCKIRLGTNCETSRVSTRRFTVKSHENESCKYMEDMYGDNDYINMTPTRYSVLITSESGDELLSLREQFIGRAEQPLLQHVPRASLVGEQYSRTCRKLCTDWTLWKVVYGLRIQQSRLVNGNSIPCFQSLLRKKRSDSVVVAY